jgi:hypothetical protein
MASMGEEAVANVAPAAGRMAAFLVEAELLFARIATQILVMVYPAELLPLPGTTPPGPPQVA